MIPYMYKRVKKKLGNSPFNAYNWRHHYCLGGVHRQPRFFLKADEVIETEVEGIGTLENQVAERNDDC